MDALNELLKAAHLGMKWTSRASVADAGDSEPSREGEEARADMKVIEAAISRYMAERVAERIAKAEINSEIALVIETEVNHSHYLLFGKGQKYGMPHLSGGSLTWLKRVFKDWRSKEL